LNETVSMSSTTSSPIPWLPPKLCGRNIHSRENKLLISMRKCFCCFDCSSSGKIHHILLGKTIPLHIAWVKRKKSCSNEKLFIFHFPLVKTIEQSGIERITPESMLPLMRLSAHHINDKRGLQGLISSCFIPSLVD
jgi:hypothetical protein